MCTLTKEQIEAIRERVACFDENVKAYEKAVGSKSYVYAVGSVFIEQAIANRSALLAEVDRLTEALEERA